MNEQGLQKDIIIEQLRNQGCRITRQRSIILDIILSEDTFNCKEVYYKALQQGVRVGLATVYRTAEALERIGVLNRNSTLDFTCSGDSDAHTACEIEFSDRTVLCLDEKEWKRIVQQGLEAEGYCVGSGIRTIRTELPEDD